MSFIGPDEARRRRRARVAEWVESLPTPQYVDVQQMLADHDKIDRLRARVAELEAAEFRLRARMAREADAPEGYRYLWVREIVDLLSGRLQ